MSNRLRDRILNWLAIRLAEILPVEVRRHVLYDLIDRVNAGLPEEKRDFWNVTSDQLYDALEGK